MDPSLAALRLCMKCDAKNSNPCSVWIFKDRSDNDKRYQQQQVKGGHFMAPASCLLSKQLLAVQAAKLPEVLACFEPEMLFLSLSLSLSPAASCPSSLRCCSQAQNCSFPSFPPAQCLPSIIHIPTLLSHCENPSVKIMLPYSYIQSHPTFSLFLPLLLNFIILIPASSASEAPWVKWPDFVAQNDDLGREQVNLLNLRSKVHSDKQIHLSFNNVSPPLAGLIGSRSWY